MIRRSSLVRLLAAAAVAAAVAAAAAAPAPAAAGPQLPWASRIERAAEFVGRVNGAIDRGVAWMKAAHGRGGGLPEYPGYPLGVDALSYHTMRVCGVPKDDPVAVRLWSSLQRTYTAGGRTTTLQTYTAALLLMAIAEHGDRVQGDPGDREVILGPADRQWAEEVVRWLVRAQNSDGTWSYGDVEDGRYARRGAADVYDNSNTQYALLGLKAAARCGLTIESKVWRQALDHFLDSQDPTGPEVLRFDPSAATRGRTSAGGPKDRARGWCYVGTGGAYGSMTAGGVGSVVICRSELMGRPAMTKALEATSETSVRDGLAWLGRNYTVTTNPGPRGSMAGPGWHYYYLYAVERAGVLAAVDWMSDRDWYGEGAKYLCDAQDADGGWQGGGGFAMQPRNRGVRAPVTSMQVTDTCFALLFLEKGTIPVRRGALTRDPDDAGIRFEAAAELSSRDFEDFLDLVLLRWRRSEDAAVKTRLFDGATGVGPRIVEPLLVRLDATDEAERAAADALLRHATGADFGFVPAAERSRREEAVLGWQGWWLSAKATLRYDAESKRLVR